MTNTNLALSAHEKSKQKADDANKRVAELQQALQQLIEDRQTLAASYDPTTKQAEKTALSVLALDYGVERLRSQQGGLIQKAEQTARRAVEAIVPEKPVLAEAVTYTLGEKMWATKAEAVVSHAPAKPAEVEKPLVYIVQKGTHTVGRYGNVGGEVELVAYLPKYVSFNRAIDGRNLSMEIGRALPGVPLQGSGWRQMSASIGEDNVVRLAFSVLSVYPEKPVLGSIAEGVLERMIPLRGYGLGASDTKGMVRVASVEKVGTTTKASVVLSYSEASPGVVNNAYIAARQATHEARGRGLVGKVIPGAGRVVTFDRVEISSNVDQVSNRPYVSFRYFVTAESVAA
ncbi:MAG: hypothetical protein ACRDPS_09665 [Nocardioides sp.]|uniref:hypothetical protein n=1 Tax=Nocardioides sp. TaxID=35761 RepID=UPI003D6A7EC0